MEAFLEANCRVLPAIFAALNFFFAAFLLGKILFSGFRFRRTGTGLVVLSVIGANFLALLALALGNRFDKKLPLLTVILLLFAIFADKSFRNSFFSLASHLFGASPKNKFGGFLSVKKLFNFSYLPLALVLLFISGRALSPPTSWDELVYQLAVPMRWISGSGSEIFYDNPYSAFPSLSGMIFRTLLSNGGFLAPRIAVLIMFTLIYISLDRILSPLCGKIARVSILTAFSFSFPVLMISSSAYSEIFIVANFAAALLLIQEKKWIMRENSFFLTGVMLGILAGAASSVKLTGFVLIPLFFILLLSDKTPRWKNILAASFFVFSAFFFCLIFYLRPYLLTGNPLYPYFAWLFSSENCTIEMSRYHHSLAVEKFGIGGLKGFLFSPLLMALDVGQFDGLLGLQFFIIFFCGLFGFLLLCRERKFSSFRFKAFAVFLVLYSFWFISSRQSRFFVPAIFALCIASTYFISLFHTRKIIFVSIIVFSIISIPAKFANDCVLSWKTSFGLIRKIDYLYSATGPGYLKVCDIVADIAASDKTGRNKFLLLFENRGLYLGAGYEIATPFVQEKYFTPPENLSAGEILEILKREKITHIIVGLSPHDPDRHALYLSRSVKIAELIGSLIDRNYLIKIWEDEGFAILKIN